MSDSSSLHLPDLTIKGFRGIEELTIPRLGRVTLLVGKNSVGKTTVLEAVRAYAARGRPSTLEEILRSHGETSTAIDEDGDEVSGPDWLSLFHGRQRLICREVKIGPATADDQLKISVGSLTDRQQEAVWETVPDPIAEEFMRIDAQAISVEFRNRKSTVGLSTGHRNGALGLVLSWSPRARRLGWRNPLFLEEDGFSSAITCQQVGPGLPDNTKVADYLDQVALTEAQERAVDALRLIFGTRVEDIATIGRQQLVFADSPKTIVKLAGYDRPVPLRSLGDGALRMFGVALALANSRDGILLIDEAENGIHYSLQREFWRMVLQAADRNNVQVIATTHGWDCIVGFARASIELGHIGSRLVRLSRARNKLRAVEYTEEEMITAAEQGIEMR